jgi:tripeptide aminopeptidase
MRMENAEPAAAGIDEDQALARLLRLIAISGKSGDEAAVIDFLRQQVIEAGVSERGITVDQAHRSSPIGGTTGNLIVRLPGTFRGPRRLLMAHTDTVPLCVGSQPVRRGGQIVSADPHTALGGDDRAGVAVVLTAVLELLQQKRPHPPLTIFWPVQEEVGLLGARFVRLAALGNPRLCFNWDGSTPHMACLGATGAYDLQIDIDGIASHAGVRPEAGVSAVTIAARAVSELQQNGWHGLILKGRHTGTSNIGVIGGGEATNVVAPHVRLLAEVRSHDPKFRDRLVREYRQAFLRAARGLKNSTGKRGTVRFSADLKYESFRLAESEPCVQEALRAIRSVGRVPETRISNGGLDANWLSARGLPTVTLGCGQREVHTVNESVDIADYLDACRIALSLATG